MAPRKQAPRTGPRPSTYRRGGPLRPRINITVAPDLAERLWAEARETDVAVSHVVEDALLAHYATLDAAKKTAA